MHRFIFRRYAQRPTERRAWIAPFCALVLLAGPGGAALAEEKSAPPVGAGPVFSASGPDADDYGAAEGFPIGSKITTAQVEYLVGAYSHFDELFESHIVARAPTPWLFRRSAHEPDIRIFNRISVADYLARNPVTSLLIAKDDTILLEHYQYGRTDHDRFMSQSMAKTITALLVGIAIEEHAIASVDDPVAAYIPGLANTEYGKTSIRNLLHMASGVQFEENYGGKDDISRLNFDLFGRPGKSPVESVAQFNTRADPAGTKFHYASIETEILGLVVARAVKKTLAAYLSEKIWQPIGAESDASWAVDGTGQEVTFCCFNAVLRDYARLGRLLAFDGEWNGQQIVPRQWLLDATTVRPSDEFLAPNHLAAGGRFGYGYQVWLLPGERRMFALLGIRGQAIVVDPASKLVLVQTAVRKRPIDIDGLNAMLGLWSAVLEKFATN